LLKSLELFKQAYAAYPFADIAKKRELLFEISSNRIIDRKEVAIELLSPFQELFRVKNPEACEACRGGTRTCVKGPDRKTFKERLLDYADEVMQKNEHGDPPTQSP
jgi:hypothetical protein